MRASPSRLAYRLTAHQAHIFDVEITRAGFPFDPKVCAPATTLGHLRSQASPRRSSKVEGTSICLGCSGRVRPSTTSQDQRMGSRRDAGRTPSVTCSVICCDSLLTARASLRACIARKTVPKASARVPSATSAFQPKAKPPSWTSTCMHRAYEGQRTVRPGPSFRNVGVGPRVPASCRRHSEFGP
jgi:hypothetical protein